MITTDRIVGKQEDLSANLAYTNPNKAPLLLNLIALGNVLSTTSTKLSWVDYTSEGTQTVIKGTVTASETSIEVEDGTIFTTGCLAIVGDEVVLIESISENTLTVKRAQHGTVAEQFKDGEEIFFLNDNLAEGADLQGARYKAGKNYENVTQIIREEIEVSGTAEAIQIPSAGGHDAYSIEKLKKMDVVIGKMEKALISGIKFEAGTKRGMGGVKSFLSNGQVIDASGETISLRTFSKLLKKIFNIGGNLAGGNYVFIVPGTQKIIISEILKKYVTANPEIKTLGAVANYIATDFGTFPLIPSNNLRSNEIIFINLDDIKLRPLGDRNLIHQYAGKTGDSTKGFILSEISLEMRNIHTMGMITNLEK